MTDYTMETLVSNILVVLSISEAIRTSLGPTSRDKLIQNEHGDIIITNDGFKCLKEMKLDHPVGKLLMNLSKSQDERVGDGTTSVVVFAGALCNAALPLLMKNLHPQQISRGFQLALQKALEFLTNMDERCFGSDKLDFLAHYSEPTYTSKANKLRHIGETSLNSKFVSRDKGHLAELCTEAVLAVTDLSPLDCHLDRIKFESKEGEAIEQTKLYKGIVLRKPLSHENMNKVSFLCFVFITKISFMYGRA
jgi:T-complex protein 1 subunit epsilon